MNRSLTILRNVASHWTGSAINAAITLALTPFVLHELGPARFGVWVLTSSIIGYYGLLDLGFRAGVTQYLTRYLAVGDHRRASECMSSAVGVLAGLGLLMMGLSVAAAWIVPQAFDLDAALTVEAFWCILIVGCASAVQFALSPFTSIFTATQRFDLANLVGVTTRLLGAAAVVATLKADLGLIGVSAATCAVSAVDYVIRWRFARRLAPSVVVARRYISVRRIREIGSFGMWNSLISVNGFVYQHVPNMLIGMVMPIAAVGYYALATGFTRQINAVLIPIGQVVYPAATQLHAQSDRRALERLYHDGSRMMLLVAIALVLPAGFWAEDFYRLWLGQNYLSGETFHSIATVFQILLLGAATSTFSTVAAPILTGAGHVRLVATALVSGSVINLSLTLLLIRPFGLAGVAMATVIASLAIDFITMPLLLQRVLGLSAAVFLRRAAVRPLAAIVLLSAASYAIRLTGRPTEWLQFIAQGFVEGLVTVVVLATIGITAAERQRYIVEPVRRLTDRRKALAPAVPDLAVGRDAKRAS